ncbi:unnamed protein product [Bursaphelenchus xylophilus]|uniref:(pine wood nematode) hypothetical protein n=1 Tax=Bursaphelenchus xylophilus TaxID=6326 RepID=A0A7I8WQ41_BURXY|nr:unnamed protein product [Bursaphelenchus xylophilus]CAG9096158.1 unnamed protein product [Bursaphelenchus xylophilus]
MNLLMVKELDCLPFVRPSLESNMAGWRAAGLTYLRYSQIAAAVTRKCAKVAAGTKSTAPAPATLKLTFWENGKQIVNKD